MLFFVAPQDEAECLFPSHWRQKLIEEDNECKLHTFCEKRTVAVTAADALGEGWKGYVVQISGGDDKQGLPMKRVSWPMAVSPAIE